MALIKCKECDNEVSSKAESCPHCGAPLKKKPKQYGCGTLILILIVLFIYIGLFSSTNDTSNTPSKPQVSDVECKKSLQCWGDRHSISAGITCKKYVEKLAKYSLKWTDGILETKFSHFRWKNQSIGIITFIGDKVQFQNGFGAWQNHIYECDFNPSKSQIIDVRASPGQL